MKRIGRVLLGLVALGLLILAHAELIEGPAPRPASVPLRQPAPVAALLTRADVMPEQADSTSPARLQSPRACLPASRGASTSAACVAESDRNGHPIVGRTYARTVYVAFPLEDMPG